MSLFESLSNSVSEIRTRVTDALGTLKQSAESYIADVVMKGAITRLKEGALNYMEQMNAPVNLKKLNEEEQKKRTAGGDSTSMMTSRLMDTPSIAGLLESHLKSFCSETTANLSDRITQTLKQEVENIDPDAIVSMLAGFLQSTMASLDKPSDASQEIPWFKTEATFQVIGLILAAFGGLLIASNLNFNAKTHEVNPMPQHENKGMTEATIEADSEIKSDLSSEAANSEIESEELEPTRNVMGL